MKTGDGLVVNFVKLSLEENDFTRWLDKKPVRYALFLQVIRRAAKNKNRCFLMSKTEYKKFGLTKSQDGQIERFLTSLVKFNFVQKTGTYQEPSTFKTGSQPHYSGACIYRLMNNEFIDLSKTSKSREQEPKKEETGTYQEGSREEIILSKDNSVVEVLKIPNPNLPETEPNKTPKVPQKGSLERKDSRDPAVTETFIFLKEFVKREFNLEDFGEDVRQQRFAASNIAKHLKKKGINLEELGRRLRVLKWAEHFSNFSSFKRLGSLYTALKTYDDKTERMGRDNESKAKKPVWSGNNESDKMKAWTSRGEHVNHGMQQGSTIPGTPTVLKNEGPEEAINRWIYSTESVLPEELKARFDAMENTPTKKSISDRIAAKMKRINLPQSV